jgi:hypothetical protein
MVFGSGLVAAGLYAIYRDVKRMEKKSNKEIQDELIDVVKPRFLKG